MDDDEFRAVRRQAFWSGFRRGVLQVALIWAAASLIGLPWLIRAGC